jgi:hypothetical protein
MRRSLDLTALRRAARLAEDSIQGIRHDKGYLFVLRLCRQPCDVIGGLGNGISEVLVISVSRCATLGHSVTVTEILVHAYQYLNGEAFQI